MQNHQQLFDALAGKLIVFEGPDGSGKTTQFNRFSELCSTGGLGVTEVREPGGTGIGEEIRRLLLAHDHGDMTLRCEMLLYMASRAQLVEQTIRPALKNRQLVLADRFVTSTLAYQGAGGGLPENEILHVARAATGGLEPDLIVIFDVDESTASCRRSAEPDRIEARPGDFKDRVRKSYLEQAKRWPDKHLVVNAMCDADGVFDRLITSLEMRFCPKARKTGT